MESTIGKSMLLDLVIRVLVQVSSINIDSALCLLLATYIPWPPSAGIVEKIGHFDGVSP